MKEKIHVALMLEILGRPAEHIKRVLEEIVEKLGKEEDVKIIEKRIAEPKIFGDGKQQNLFTSFAEVELETSLGKLMLLIFSYMPSHIEIIRPEDLKIKNSDLNIFMNELARRLHQYDELAKALMIERQNIARMIKEGKIKIRGKGAGKRSKKGVKKRSQKKS